MTFRELTERAEQYIIEIVAGRCRTRGDRGVRALLFLLSRLYLSVIQLRISLYETRILRRRMLGCLVVSIGNLTVGGTGKTPVVEVFAKTLAERGRRVAVLSRGYRSKNRPAWGKLWDLLFRKNHEIPPKIVSDGERLLLNSRSAGDEPFMLASNLKDVMVLVDKDRVKAGKHAIRHMQADTLVLDDGFQYLKLKPHANILLVDSTLPFANHHLLPRGLLREPIRNLRRADYVFLTKSDSASRLRHLKRFIRAHNSRAEIIACTHQAKHLEDVYTEERFALDELRGRPVAAISAIAVPESFEKFLGTLGANVVYAERFMDHHSYRQQEIIDFLNAAAASGAEMIVTTEKDAVRFPKLDRRDVPIRFLRVEIDILSGEESFNECISRLCFQ